MSSLRCRLLGHRWERRLSGWRCRRCRTFIATNPYWKHE